MALLKFIDDGNGTGGWTAVEDISGSNGQPVDVNPPVGLLDDSHLNNLNINHVKNLSADLVKLDTSGGIVQGNIELGGSYNLLSNKSSEYEINLGRIIDTASNFSVANFRDTLIGNGIQK